MGGWPLFDHCTIYQEVINSRSILSNPIRHFLKLWIFAQFMSYRRDHRPSRAALIDNYDSIEEGGLRTSSSYSHGISDHENEGAMDSLQDRISFLKRLTGDIHEEVESHNRMLDRMGNEMDASRGIMSGTMDRFKMVFEKKSNRKICKLALYFVVGFFVLYYTFRVLLYFLYG
ncbi:Bet1-like SNARE 1-2 [Forsythia ovata]|uniref:Bet1-like SNARE 1-2 n=1 Tax=Forsythia ovata TaxID=205694 RepID=A0ABD1PIH9_9LAMI